VSGPDPDPLEPEIPPFREDGTLPPFRGVTLDPDAPGHLGPHRTSASGLVRAFAFSPARRDRLRGLLDYRAALRAVGSKIRGAVQWIGGSFVERANVEPRDLDVVTFAMVDATWLDLGRGRIADAVLERHRDLLMPAASRDRWGVDMRFLLANRALDAIHAASAWSAFFSHTRRGRWRGFVEVPLDSDDERARSLLALAEDAGPGPSSLEADPAEPELDARELVAYRLTDAPSIVSLAPAPATRRWMDDSSSRFAYRCLPLLMANQAGWFITLKEAVEVEWDGGEGSQALRIAGSLAVLANVVSHFGQGIVTFRLPYLFRTSPGRDLLVRGPANLFKDGASPLEGLVESDWSVAPFTMNWKITRPRHCIRFEAGEPIAMLVPSPRGDLERFAPSLSSLADDEALARRYRRWFEGRAAFLRDLDDDVPEAVAAGWQKDYFRGEGPGDTVALEHRTKLRLRPFVER
jgi:hypothetical protein